MSEKPKLAFNNVNYSAIGESSDINETRLHALEASDKIYQQISDAQDAANEACRESLVDPLTGCYNRRYLEKYKEENFDPVRNNNQIGLIFVDLNGLKKVNDSEGHSKGDELLKETAEFLRLNTRKNDVVVRFGGDEFIVICHNYDCAEDFENELCIWTEERLATLSTIDMSFGCAVYDMNRDKSLEETQILADARMYAYKRRTNR